MTISSGVTLTKQGDLRYTDRVTGRNVIVGVDASGHVTNEARFE